MADITNFCALTAFKNAEWGNHFLELSSSNVHQSPPLLDIFLSIRNQILKLYAGIEKIT